MLRERRGSWVLLGLSSIVTGPAFERVECLIESEALDRSQEVDDITACGMNRPTLSAPSRPATSKSKQIYTLGIDANSAAQSARKTRAPPVDVTARKPCALRTRRSNSPSQMMMSSG